jgi:hypothetical protein
MLAEPKAVVEVQKTSDMNDEIVQITNATPNKLLTELYFGLSSQNGIGVSQQALSDFVLNSVTPHYQGYTVLAGLGYYGMSQEQTVILRIVHDPTREHATRIVKICKDYSVRFGQECVMVTTTPVCAAFIGAAAPVVPPISTTGSYARPVDAKAAAIVMSQ